MILYKDIFQALADSGVRYLVAGGVALNLHQIVRATVDLDLIVHLECSNVLKFVSALKKLGYKPKVPVAAEDFADEEKRESWIHDKNMVVFSFIHPSHPFEMIDVFVREPMPFEELYARRKEVKAFEVVIPVIGEKDLMAMKEKAGREKDLYDIKLLKKRNENGTT